MQSRAGYYMKQFGLIHEQMSVSPFEDTWEKTQKTTVVGYNIMNERKRFEESKEQVSPSFHPALTYDRIEEFQSYQQKRQQQQSRDNHSRSSPYPNNGMSHAGSLLHRSQNPRPSPPKEPENKPTFWGGPQTAAGTLASGVIGGATLYAMRKSGASQGISDGIRSLIGR